MPVNPEQPEKAASKQPDIPADSASSISSFTSNVQQFTWKETQKRHDFGDNSATQLLLTPEQRQLLAQSPGGQQFGIDGLKEHAGRTDSAIKSEVNPHYMPAVTEDKVCSVIEKLGSDKHRWSLTTPPHGPKCNLFVDAVMHDSKIPRPWGDKGAPLCLDIQAQLANDSRFNAAWSTDYGNYAAAYQNWARFQLRPGDICLWNTNYVTHGAIAVDGEHFAYAGAHEGYKQAPISFVCGTGKDQTNYGPPTKVFRYNGIVSRR